MGGAARAVQSAGPPPLNKSPAAAAARGIAADLGVPSSSPPQPMSWGASIPNAVPSARQPSGPQLTIEEPEIIDDAEVVEDEDDRAARSIPSLEPPRPPNAAQMAERAKVDVWALADEAGPGGQASIDRVYAEAARGNDASTQSYSAEGNDIEAIEEIEIDEIPVERRREASGVGAAPVVQATAAAAAPAIAAAAAVVVPGMSHDELVRVAKEVIEKIAWEVVPELAETIIRAELDRLLRDRE
jgi:hypothetical protein